MQPQRHAEWQCVDGEGVCDLDDVIDAVILTDVVDDADTEEVYDGDAVGDAVRELVVDGRAQYPNTGPESTCDGSVQLRHVAAVLSRHSAQLASHATANTTTIAMSAWRKAPTCETGAAQ